MNVLQAIPAKVTPKLVQEMDELVKSGWYANRSEVIRDGVRELVRKMKSERLMAAIKEDTEWGLK